MRIEVWHGKVGKRQAWFWHLRAKNGKIVTDAESFPSRSHALRAAKALVRSIVKPVSAEFIVFELWLPGSRKGMAPGRSELRWS